MTLEEMEKRIRAEMKEGDFVFLKGSRRAGLDKVAERLKAGYFSMIFCTKYQIRI